MKHTEEVSQVPTDSKEIPIVQQSPGAYVAFKKGLHDWIGSMDTSHCIP